MPDELLARINGREFSGWKSLSLTKTRNTLVGSFDLGASRFHPDRGEDQLVNGFDKVELFLGEELMLTGLVEVFTPSPNDMTISGRGLAGQLVDCMVIHKSGSWKKVKLSSLIRELIEPFGVVLVYLADFDPVLEHETLKAHEKVWAFIDRVLTRVGLKAWSSPAGEMVIGRADRRKRAKTSIRRIYKMPDWLPDESNNVISGAPTIRFAGRFSHVYVDGQTSGSDVGATSDGTECSGLARDNRVPIYRPFSKAAQGRASIGDCQAQAEWEVANRMGQAFSFPYVVSGFRQYKEGPLWDVDMIVSVKDDVPQLYRDMLISEVRFSASAGTNGTMQTSLTVVPPEMAEPKPVQDIQDEAWGNLREYA